MNSKLKVLLSLVAMSFVMVSCGTPAPAPQLKDYTFTKAPNVNSYKAIIKNETGKELKDAQSAQYKFGTPFKGYMRDRNNKMIWTGWAIPYEVNAKNSYGAYVGYTSFRAAIMSRTEVVTSEIQEVHIDVYDHFIKAFK